jgi:hypothetical protein
MTNQLEVLGMTKGSEALGMTNQLELLGRTGRSWNPELRELAFPLLP